MIILETCGTECFLHCKLDLIVFSNLYKQGIHQPIERSTPSFSGAGHELKPLFNYSGNLLLRSSICREPRSCYSQQLAFTMTTSSSCTFPLALVALSHTAILHENRRGSENLATTHGHGTTKQRCDRLVASPMSSFRMANTMPSICRAQRRGEM